MCSVTFIPRADGFLLGMNRDESLSRPAANPPERRTRTGRLALYPTEPTGGSWIGLNDTGLTLALINWYAVPRAPGIGRVSRGIVVPSLLAAASLDEVRAAMVVMPKQDMAPFRLLAFSSVGRTAFEFCWDQRTLEEVPHAWEPQHWFSSGHDEPRAQLERAKVARKAWQQPRAGTPPWLRRLHASHEPARGPCCFCMHRKEAATVSYTEIVVTTHAATMRYHDGPLCTAPQPRTIRKLSLQATHKESALIPTRR